MMRRDIAAVVGTRRARSVRAASVALAAVLGSIAAGCSGGGSGNGDPPAACTISYAGGATETVWCDAPVVRTNGSGGYVLSVMAFRGPAGLRADQAGQLTLTLSSRPVAGVDYAFTGTTIGAGVASGFETRTESAATTHEAVAGDVGALTVRFSSIPATDGPDPGGWDGIGPVHGSFTATLVPVGAGTDVTATGSF